LPGQPGVAVEIDLQPERCPSGDTHVAAALSRKVMPPMFTQKTPRETILTRGDIACIWY
jgi:hypothetical protein